METRSCATCRYRQAMMSGGLMECRRYPPMERAFPIVRLTEWCGEWMMMKAGKR